MIEKTTHTIQRQMPLHSPPFVILTSKLIVQSLKLRKMESINIVQVKILTQSLMERIQLMLPLISHDVLISTDLISILSISEKDILHSSHSQNHNDSRHHNNGSHSPAFAARHWLLHRRQLILVHFFLHTFFTLLWRESIAPTCNQ